MLKKWPLISLLAATVLSLSACSTTSLPSANIAMDNTTNQYAADAKAEVQLGLAYLQRGEYPQAKAQLVNAASIAPQLAQTHYALGYYYMKVKDTQRAKVQYDKALAIAPHDPQVLNSYGVYLCEIGQYEQSVQYFMQAIQNQGFDHVGLAYENSGLCILKANKKSQAMKYFVLATNHNPQLAVSYYYLALLSAQNQNYPAARQYWHQYNQLQKPNKASLELGMVIARGLHDYEWIEQLQRQLDNLQS